MTDRVRVAVAGLGVVAQAVHLPLLARRWDLFEVAAVCDLSPGLRDAVGEQYGVRPHARYSDVEEMLAGADADATVLLTSGSHGAAALRSLSAGMPVFCEKPLAYTAAEADELAAAESAADGSALLLAYMKERDDAVARMADLLTSVDGIRAVEVRVLHPSPESQLAFANLRPPAVDVPPQDLERLMAGDSALLDAALGAGTPDWFRRLYATVVVGSLIHDISLLRRLVGGLDQVDDVRVWPGQAFPPSVEVSGSLPGGARARLAWHYLEDYPAYRETVAVHHSRGSLQVTFGTPYLLNAPTELEVIEAAAGGEVRSTYRSKGEAFENELVEFHRMVTEGIAPLAGIAHGRADIISSQRIMARLADQEGIDIGGEAATRGG
ncbi:MAG TPA: Gfo/Idh/MocA family oxidoreductase [Jiangellales bacterium]|nr:Gfo/Idh/MocA family oxidoreductase [Jiangellales bacterium]